MPFDVFCERVNELAKRTGNTVCFANEDGKHIARCSDGVTIVGNAISRTVSVMWGSNHRADAVI